MNSLRNTFMTVYRGRLYPNHWDLLALFLVFSLIGLFAESARQMSVPYHVGQATPIFLDPSYLPGYALRTVSRMLIALFFSLLFTFVFATWAAKSKRAERLIIPIIDILQSVPILGFLSITVVGFITLFPGSLLGPECAAIFVIFTSQAWNMALGFYQTVRSVPSDLVEAADMFHLSAWQRFWRIEVPFSMPGLLWNMMISMSAGWFFVVASEAISVSNQEILLPGIGSYIATAIASENIHAILYAILTMFIVILIYDQLFFRPLVSWAHKFRAEQVESERDHRPWVIHLLHRTRLLRLVGNYLNALLNAFVNIKFLRSKPITYQTYARSQWMERWAMVIWNLIFGAIIVGMVGFLVYFIFFYLPWSEEKKVLLLGLITALRVFVLIIVCTLIWVPIGVWVGLRPGVAAIVQPIAQFFAAFPANLFYPLAVIGIIRYHLNVDIFLTPLIILGSQWYILFNVIAGASVIPKDLLQAADNLNVHGWLRWRRLILPGIFPYYITGAITAVGGAWNASILAEVVSWGGKKLVAHGLGAYIYESTTAGDFFHIALGIGMMSLLVLVFNHLIWRPLYVLAESRYQLD